MTVRIATEPADHADVFASFSAMVALWTSLSPLAMDPREVSGDRDTCVGRTRAQVGERQLD